MRLLSVVLTGGIILSLAGCSPSRIAPPTYPHGNIELSHVPFHPQQQYQCGPASLATLLNASDIEVSPDELARRIYIPDKQGSLQAELVAATRTHHRLAYILEPRFEAVLSQLHAGHPVIVLQNLGISTIPSWHYAVVIGFDQSNKSVILRSGMNKRKAMNFSLFMKTWNRANNWALIVLKPGDMPVNPDFSRYMRAAADLEAIAFYSDAEAAYLSAVNQWPGNYLPRFALGNVYYLQTKYSLSIKSYQQSLKLSNKAVIYNNLAQAMLAMNCHRKALEVINAGLSKKEINDNLSNELEKTRHAIQQASQSNNNPENCHIAE